MVSTKGLVQKKNPGELGGGEVSTRTGESMRKIFQGGIEPEDGTGTNSTGGRRLKSLESQLQGKPCAHCVGALRHTRGQSFATKEQESK